MPAGSALAPAHLHRERASDHPATASRAISSRRPEALELAGRGARQLAHDLDLPRPLVGRQRALQEPPHLRPQRLRLRGRIAGHHEHEGLDEAAVRLGPDDRRRRGRPGAGAGPIRSRPGPPTCPATLKKSSSRPQWTWPPSGLAAIDVAGPEPIAHEASGARDRAAASSPRPARACAPRGRLPRPPAPAGPPRPGSAGLRARHRRRPTIRRGSGPGRLASTMKIGLGGAEPVEDLDAEPLPPGGVDLRRQPLASRDAERAPERECRRRADRRGAAGRRPSAPRRRASGEPRASRRRPRPDPASPDADSVARAGAERDQEARCRGRRRRRASRWRRSRSAAVTPRTLQVVVAGGQRAVAVHRRLRRASRARRCRARMPSRRRPPARAPSGAWRARRSRWSKSIARGRA